VCQSYTRRLPFSMLSSHVFILSYSRRCLESFVHLQLVQPTPAVASIQSWLTFFPHSSLADLDEVNGGNAFGPVSTLESPVSAAAVAAKTQQVHTASNPHRIARSNEDVFV